MSDGIYLSNDSYQKLTGDLFEQDARGTVADQFQQQAMAAAPDMLRQAQQDQAQQAQAAETAAQQQRDAAASQFEATAPQMAADHVASMDPSLTAHLGGGDPNVAAGLPTGPDVTPPAVDNAAAVPPTSAAPPPAVAPTSPVTTPMTPATGYEAVARAAAQKYGVDPDIFARQIQQESGFNPNARSGAGAIGIAQFMPATAQGMGIDPTDPNQALDGAARLMSQNLQKYGGDYSKALAAYNAGGGNVDKYGGVPPFAETQKYVSNILSGAKQLAQNVGDAVQQVARDPSQILDAAKPFLGSQYVWGGKSPQQGFDCSGLAGYLAGTGTPESTTSLYAKSAPISAKDAQPGDLVFYNMGQSDMSVQHVATLLDPSKGTIIQSGGTQHDVNIGTANQAVGSAPEYRRIGPGGTPVQAATAPPNVQATQPTDQQAAQTQPSSPIDTFKQKIGDAFSEILAPLQHLLGGGQQPVNAPGNGYDPSSIVPQVAPAGVPARPVGAALPSGGSTIFDQAGSALAANQANPPLAGLGNTIATSGANQLRHDYFPNITEPNHPLNVLQDIESRYGIFPDESQMTPEDRARYESATLSIGGVVAPLGAKFDKYGVAVSQPAEVQAALKGGAPQYDQYGVQQGFTPPPMTGALAPALDATAPTLGRDVASTLTPGSGPLAPTAAAQETTDTLQGLVQMAKSRGIDTSSIEAQMPQVAVPSQSVAESLPIQTSVISKQPGSWNDFAVQEHSPGPLSPSDIEHVNALAQQDLGANGMYRAQQTTVPFTNDKGSFLVDVTRTSDSIGKDAGGRPIPRLEFSVRPAPDVALPTTPTVVPTSAAAPDVAAPSGPLSLKPVATGGVEPPSVPPVPPADLAAADLPGIPPPTPGKASFADVFRAYHTGNVVSGLATLTHVALNSIVAPAWSFTTRGAADIAGGHIDRAAGSGIGAGAGLADSGRAIAQAFSDHFSNPNAIFNQTLPGALDNGVAKMFLKAQAVPTALHAVAQSLTQNTIMKMEVGRLAGEEASQAGLSGQAWKNYVANAVANPTGPMAQQAEGVAQRAALRGDLGTIGQNMTKIANVPYVGNTLFPVVRISTNALTQGIEKSPIGLLGTGFDVARAAIGKSGPYAGPQGFAGNGIVAPLSERLTNNIAGSALTAWLATKALDGSITGQGPSDGGQREELIAQGWQPNSVYVPGRGYVDIHATGTLAPSFALAGSYGDAVKYGGAKGGSSNDATQIAESMFMQMGKYLEDATGMRTIGQLYDIFHTQGVGLNQAAKAGALFGSQLVGGFVPESAMLRGIATASDDYARKPAAAAGDLPSLFGQDLSQGFPGLRENVPVKQNIWGEPQANNQQGWGVFAPRTGTGSPDPDIKALMDAGVKFPALPNQVAVSSKYAIDLTPDEKLQFQSLRGELVKQMLDGIANDPSFAQAPIEKRQQFLQKIFAQADKDASRQLVAKVPDGDLVNRVMANQERRAPVAVGTP